MKELKENQLETTYKNFINKEVTMKMLDQLSKILLSLFGKTLGEKAYFDFFRKKQVCLAFCFLFPQG